MLENLLWTLCAAALLYVTTNVLHLLLITVYVGFMLAVDLPMYWKRHLAKADATRSVRDGVWLLLTDFRVTRSFDDWSEEMAWQFGYFSGAVWTSLALCVISQ